MSVQTAAADPDECRLFCQAPLHRLRMKRVEMFHRLRRSEGVPDRDVRMMKAPLQQLQRRATLGEGIGELHAPGPGIAGKGFLRFHDPRVTTIAYELRPRETVPLIRLVIRRPGVECRAFGEADQAEQQQAIQQQHGWILVTVDDGASWSFLSECDPTVGLWRTLNCEGDLSTLKGIAVRFLKLPTLPNSFKGLSVP